MKKYLSILLALTLLAALTACTVTPVPTAVPTAEPTPGPAGSELEAKSSYEVKDDADSIFVDAANGDDAAAGTMSAPVKTLAKAQEMARTKLATALQTVTVYLRGGTYELTETLTFTAADSAEGKNIVFTSYAGEDVIVSGGKAVTGWTLADADKNIWSAPAADIESRDFFVNDVRATRARLDEFRCVSISNTGLYFMKGVSADLARPQDVEAVFLNMWNMVRVDGQSVSEEDGVVELTMKQPAWGVYWNTADLGGVAAASRQLAWLENAYEFLDSPGEWYLNTETDTIYYIPREDEDLATANTVLGNLEQLILFNGEKDAIVSGITFDGMSFKYTTWLQASSDEGLVTVQANVYKKGDMTEATKFDDAKWLTPSAAIYGTMDHDIRFTHNVFTCLGNGGIHLEAGTKNALISYNKFVDCASTGISLGGFHTDDHNAINRKGSNWNTKSYLLTENNSITDNYICNCASVYAGGTGIAAGYVRYTDISYNTILDMPYTGITLGWGWGFSMQELGNVYYLDSDGKFLFRDNTITHNYIENIMNVLFDGGGIYTLGRNDNSTISDNYISKVNNDYGAIYLDDGSAGFTVTNNVVANAYRNYIYKGDYNSIFNNYTTKGTAHESDLDMRVPLKAGEYHYTFENNYQWDEAAVQAIKDAAGVRTR